MEHDSPIAEINDWIAHWIETLIWQITVGRLHVRSSGWTQLTPPELADRTHEGQGAISMLRRQKDRIAELEADNEALTWHLNHAMYHSGPCDCREGQRFI